MRILDKYFEADEVAVASGTPLVPGESSRDLTIPAGETWEVIKFGGTTNKEYAETILLYSEDGVNFVNPFDAEANAGRIRKLHLGENTSEEQELFMVIEGNGTRMIRIISRNYNTVETSEIIAWIHGRIY